MGVCGWGGYAEGERGGAEMVGNFGLLVLRVHASVRLGDRAASERRDGHRNGARHQAVAAGLLQGIGHSVDVVDWGVHHMITGLVVIALNRTGAVSRR